jgi:hypothetical protein
MKKCIYLLKIRPAVLPRSRDYTGGDWAWETRQEAVIHYFLMESCTVDISMLDGSGKVIRALTGTNDPGVNRAVWDLDPEKEERGQAVFRRGIALVKPGVYAVVIQAGEIKLESKICVEPPHPERD